MSADCLKRLRGAFWAASDVILHESFASGSIDDTLTLCKSNLFTEQSGRAGTAIIPVTMRGSSKAKRFVQHSEGVGGGGGARYSKEIRTEMVPFSPTLPQRKNDTSIV